MIKIPQNQTNKIFEKDIQDLFLANFYRDHGYTIVERAPQDRLCDWDAILEKDGKQIMVEEKIIRRVYPQIAIELIEDIKSGKQGWFFQIGVDKLIWIFTDGKFVKEVWSIDWPAFKKWYQENCQNSLYFEFPQDTGEIRLAFAIDNSGWGKSLLHLIPIKNIPENIIKLMWGKK